jgi:multidrug efflux pump subunit AcrA (membrane-fusion protein)
MSSFTLSFSDYFAAQRIDLLVDLSLKINQELMKLLSQNADVVKQGRVMAQLAPH